MNSRVGGPGARPCTLEARSLDANKTRRVIDSDLKLLPPELAALSMNRTEIALPYPEVIAAIEHLQRHGVKLLGWEALRSSAHGGPPYMLLQGSADISRLSPRESAAACRVQIDAALHDPYYGSEGSTSTLYFILTVDAP